MELERALTASLAAPPGRDAEGRILAEYRFAGDFPAFSGHFPGRPVCPAIVQVLAALHALKAVLGAPLVLTGLDNAKFQKPLGPGEPLTVRCVPKDGGRFDAELKSGGAPVARFTLAVAEEG